MAFHKVTATAYDVAESLFQAAESEAEFRAAASRAYMAAMQHFKGHLYCVAFSWSGRGEDHGALIRHLQSHADRPARRAGTALRRLRHIRNMADYELNYSFNRSLAEEACRTCYEIIYELVPR